MYLAMYVWRLTGVLKGYESNWTAKCSTYIKNLFLTIKYISKLQNS